MNNPCLWASVTVTTGAVAAFFICIGIFTRGAYRSGFAAGFAAARTRFEKLIKIAKAEKLFRGLLDEPDADADADENDSGAQW